MIRSLIRQLRRLDWIMVVAMILLLGIGIAFVYSAGYREADPAGSRLCQKQMIWAGIGLLGFLVFALIDYHRWTHRSWWLYGLGLVLLALVFVPHIGLKVYGARRWLQVAGLRVIQPAEFMKLAAVIALARLFGRPGRNPRRWRYVIAGLLMVLLPMVLLIKQPDLGSALIFLPVLAAVMFVAGVPLRTLGLLAGLGSVLVILLLGAITLPPRLGWAETRTASWLKVIGITPYQRERILVFFDRDRDPLGAGWNKAQSQMAVGSGRLTGKGYLRGTQNSLGFLPRTVAPNDFIFSVIAEEKGWSGALTVLALFGVLLGRGLRTALVARDKTGRLLVTGIITMLFAHVFVNIAMTIGLLPITGIPLPLISYGGSFLLGTLSALGMVQSVYIRGDWV